MEINNLNMNTYLKASIRILFLSSALFLPFNSVQAGTVLEDVQLTLFIETQDLEHDFKDEGESFEKERQVIYKINVTNQGEKTLNDLRLFMEEPFYMSYQPGSTKMIEDQSEKIIKDQNENSTLSNGYKIDNLPAGSSIDIEIEYKAKVPDSVKSDPVHTVASASLVGRHSSIPVMSNVVQNQITGEATGSLNLEVTSFPSAGQTVFPGSTIRYLYQLKNAGGQLIDSIQLTNYIPKGTSCIENCGLIQFNEPLAPGENMTVEMTVQALDNVELDQIEHKIVSIKTDQMEKKDLVVLIHHPINHEMKIGSGEFTLYTEQVPNLILNSPNQSPRPDQADLSETQYVIQYTGRGKPNTFNLTGNFGIYESGNQTYQGYCSNYQYDHGKGSTVYAYNSSGGNCEKMSNCRLSSKTLDISLSSEFPNQSPSLITDGGQHSKTKIYHYGDTGSVNQFMQMGGVIKAPEKFTVARAIEDGSMGIVNSKAELVNLSEDLWTYKPNGQIKTYDTCSCGEDCIHTDQYPVYTWQKTSSTPLTPEDEDQTPISVYSSTAWLKTEGGHVGTNQFIQSGSGEYNQVNLTFGGSDYMEPNEWVYEPNKILTPSHLYSPTGEVNADYLVFSGKENDFFRSASGKAWEVEGADLDFINRGNAYDRTENPRDFETDLLEHEFYGEVKIDHFHNKLNGIIDIQNGVVWHQTGDLVIGKEGINDQVKIKGGQSRLYVEGDVYLNADILYDPENTTQYADIPSLRIDAHNIYVSGEVEDLEILLLARNEFHSGESHEQLRILGDVIAKKTYWERKPYLEQSPEAINEPSEHLIEDMRKYVVPVPGDQTLPNEYQIWQQVNPSSGDVLDPYNQNQ